MNYLGQRAPRALLLCSALLGLIALAGVSAEHAGLLSRAPVAARPSLFAPAALSVKIDTRADTRQSRPEEPESKPEPAPQPSAVINTLVVGKGDTLIGLLVAAGSNWSDAQAAVEALTIRFDPRRLRIGQEVTVVLDAKDASAGPPRLAVVSLAFDDAYLVVLRRGNGFLATRSPSPLPSLGSAGDAVPRTTLRIREGDTLMNLLVRAGVTPSDAHAAVNALGRHFDLRRMRIGQELTVVFDPGDGPGGRTLATVSLAIDGGTYVVAGRNDKGTFQAKKARAPLVPAFTARRAEPAAAAAPRAQQAEKTPEPSPPETPATEPANDPPPPPATARADAVNRASTADAEAALVTSQPMAITTAPGAPARSNGFDVLRVREGDTLMGLLLRAGGTPRDAYAAVTALGRHYDMRRLQIGQELAVVFYRRTGEPKGRSQLAAVGLAINGSSYVVAGRRDDGSFSSAPAHAPLSAALDAALSHAAPIAPEPEITFVPAPADALQTRLRVQNGDTLMDALLRNGSGATEAQAAIDALSARFDPRRLRAGQLLTITLDPGDGDAPTALHSVALAFEPGRSVEAGRAETGGFAVREVEIPLDRVLVHAGGRINSSLYGAATKVGVPNAVLMALIRAFSFDVDFQRDIQTGDRFEVLFERYVDETGEVVREGSVLYAALTLGDWPLEIYRFVMSDGYADYFDDNGLSVRKALLRTPVHGARLSSGYGKRKHPIDGYTKMHRGLDFRAPRGTPVVAAGDGVIARIGRNGKYGRYIRIRHRGLYSTAYAHLNGYAKGLRKGSRVRQGQVIGYVGSSGVSTGAHLHYEVLRDGRQINPKKIRLPEGPKLSGETLASFRETREEIIRQLAALPLARDVAGEQASPPPCGSASRTAATTEGSAQPARC